MRCRGEASLILRGARLLDPGAGRDEVVDLRIEAGVVTAIGPRLAPARELEELDLSGLCLSPGLTDMHVHLREPGSSHKETIRTGTRAAVKGGFTAVACMPNTSPVLDRRNHVEEVTRAPGKACPVHPIGALTKGLAGEELAEFGELVDAGCVAFSDDGRGLQSAAMTLRAMQFCRMYDRPLIQHLEDETLSAGGVVHEGVLSTRLGLRGIPVEAETVMLARDLMLVERVGCRYHAAHVSCARSVELIRDAKERDLPVTAEACPHHFDLTQDAVGDYDTAAKVNPPLRPEEDRRALEEGLADGTIEVIATDHAPHSAEEKALEFPCCPFGIDGLETALGICLDRLYHRGEMELLDVVDRLTAGPARVLGLRGRDTVAVDAPADLVIFDPDVTWTVFPQPFESRSTNTPYLGRTLRGRAVHTFVAGQWWDLLAV